MHSLIDLYALSIYPTSFLYWLYKYIYVYLQAHVHWLIARHGRHILFYIRDTSKNGKKKYILTRILRIHTHTHRSPVTLVFHGASPFSGLFCRTSFNRFVLYIKSARLILYTSAMKGLSDKPPPDIHFSPICLSGAVKEVVDLHF